MIKWTGKDTSRVIKWNEEANDYFELLCKLMKRGLVHDFTDLEGDTFNELLNYSTELQELNSNDDTETIYQFDFFELVTSLTDEQIESIISSNRGKAYYQLFEKVQDVKINGHTIRVSENTYHCLNAYLNHFEHCDYYGQQWIEDGQREENNFIENLCADNKVDVLIDILERCECTFDELTEKLRNLKF